MTKGQVIAQLSGDDDLRPSCARLNWKFRALRSSSGSTTRWPRLITTSSSASKVLFKQGLRSERDVERAQFKSDGAVLEIEKSRVAGQVAQAKVTEVKVQLAKSTVYAPITGIVTHRFAKLGTNVIKNEKLFEITQLAPLEVRFQVPQTEKGGLGPRQHCESFAG